MTKKCPFSSQQEEVCLLPEEQLSWLIKAIMVRAWMNRCSGHMDRIMVRAGRGCDGKMDASSCFGHVFALVLVLVCCILVLF